MTQQTNPEVDALIKQLPSDQISITERVKQFKTLLAKIVNTNDKKKALWAEIYENAIIDRQNAHIMWTQLMLTVNNDATQHAIHGPNLAKYIERMSKANDQLIKLAELIANAEMETSSISNEELFNKINS